MQTAIAAIAAIALLLASVSSAAMAQEAGTESVPADEIIVFGDPSQVSLTDPYAGGQVARGGRAGLLGNLDFLDAPFSGTAFTEQLISNQQSVSVGEVLRNDPVVRIAKGFGNFQELFVIRGFPVFSDDLTLNGVFGILPRQFVAAELLERVEVFRGANAFVNGAAPGGSGVGGTVNLVPKRAPDDGIRQVTLGYLNASQFYGATDFGTRFGPGDAWGVRVNAVYRDGEGAIEDQNRELGMVSVGTDYQGESLRFSADIGYQDNRLNDPRPQVTPVGEVPDVPDPQKNFAQPGTFTDEEQLFGAVRGELDITDAVTVWLAGGGRRGDEANILLNPTAAADGSTTAFRFDNTREDTVLSADTGVRAEFVTGPVGHRVVVSASLVDLKSKNAFALSDFINPVESDLFDPTPLPSLPEADFFTGGVLSDPLTTEKVTNQSLAIADTLALFDDRLLVTGGLRYQAIETKSFDFNTGELASEFDEDAVTPAAGVVFKPIRGLSLYGNYAESLQPGEIAPSTSGGIAIENAGEVLDPFRGEQIEIGVKYDAGTFGATLSLFTLDRQNAIVVDRVFQASGNQENQGVEISIFGEPVDGLRLVGGATYIDSEFKRTQDGVNEGNTPIGIPEIQASVNAEWDVPIVPGLTIDGRVIYTGEQFVNEANTVELEDWARLDLGLRYVIDAAGGSLTLKARLDNVTNNAFWASTGGFPGANFLILGDPRTFKLSASYGF